MYEGRIEGKSVRGRPPVWWNNRVDVTGEKELWNEGWSTLRGSGGIGKADVFVMATPLEAVLVRGPGVGD